jgi:peptidoglycan/xylan/chitin deacetylase (PgdA/CDA1 family)
MTRLMYTRPWAEYGPRLRAITAALVERRLVDPAVLTPPAAITWAEVATLARDPVVSFESHGVTHTAVAALSRDEREHELVASQRAIAERTGRACRHFCYPYGGPRASATWHRRTWLDTTARRRRCRAGVSDVTR